MAKISTNTAETTFQIKNWLGLNESPDGDTDLKIGEASVMRNFRVTRERNLQIRSGYAQRHKLGTGPVRCLWSGYVSGVNVLLSVCSGHLWRVDGDAAVDCGAVNDGHAFIFGFSGNAYILAGGEYYRWDGAALSVVSGYAPLISVATPPAGGGTLLEPVNRLNGKRRQRFSPDGTETAFKLAESGLVSISAVSRSDGKELPAWTADTATGTVNFSEAPVAGTDCITIEYDKGTSDRSSITSMKFAEIYGGTTDSRVFLYGDGTNRTFYSDIDDNGNTSAEYFPDLNILTAGASNTPITGMIRHFSRMIIFKLDGAWSVASSSMTLSDNLMTAAFYLTPIQRDIGNVAPGQVHLVGNNPRTVADGAIYEWRSTSSYLGSSDERILKRLSQRVEATLQTWDAANCIAFDDDYAMEWYLFHNGNALVQNYENDSWYIYTNIFASCMERHGKDLFFGTPTGEIMHFDSEYRNDNGSDIDAYWESGAMAFDRDWQRKYSANMWVAMKPESQGRVTVTMRSNKKSDYAEKVVSSSLSTLSHVDFAHWSFATNREPQVKRVRIKVKKFTYSTLIFRSKSSTATATILGVDFKIRYTGNVKQR